MDYQAIASNFYDVTFMNAVILMGSHARGEAQSFSDIDLVCIVNSDTPNEPETHYINDQLVVVSQVNSAQTETWFNDPKTVVEVMRNVQMAKPLIDPTGFFAQLQKRAHHFAWTDALREKANDYAANQLVGLVEEVHKGLNGLQQYHAGRLINACHGLGWGLTYTLLVYRGVLVSGDNGLFDGAQLEMKIDSEWSRYHRLAFGIGDTPENTPSLVERTQASLNLYRLTYEITATVCQPDEQHLIEKAISKTETFFAQNE